MPAASLPPLLWLSASDVSGAMPDIEERLRLAEVTLTAFAHEGRAQLPAKIAIHPRPTGSFVHAMPALLRAEDPAGDLVGMKWVAAFPTNNERGLAAISAVVVVNDPGTGLPSAIVDGGPITAERTAAVSGVAIRRYGPTHLGRTPRVALLGAGVQGHSHVPVLAHLLPGLELRLFDRDPARAAALAERARTIRGVANVSIRPTARDAVLDADVVVSAASFGTKAEAQSMTNAWLRPDATVVPIDYATYCAAEVARDASLFLVDEREQFLANRGSGAFDGYPYPDATIGEAIVAGTPRPPGRVVVTHLGVGLADLVFADAIVRVARERGLGTPLPR